MEKVLIVLSTLNTGGAQRAFSNIIMALPKDWEIDILLNDSEEIVYPYRGNIIDLGIKPQKNKNKIFYQLKVFIKRYFMLKKIKRNNGYTACVSALESANIVNILSGNRYCKNIVSVRCFKSTTQNKIPLKGLVDLMIQLLYNYADKVVAVSNGIAADLQECYNIKQNKIVTIYNGYHVEQIRKSSLEVCKEIDFNELGENVIVTSGRLSVQKGHCYLIRALSMVKESIPDIKLVLLGEGILKPELEQMILEYHLEKNVIMVGFVKNPFPILINSKVFILSSLFEGFPNVLAEAIICGIPCISTDCATGPREILAPGTKERKSWGDTYEKADYGLLCPVFHTEKLPKSTAPLRKEERIMALAIMDMLQNSEMYSLYKERCRKKAESLDINHVIKQWEKVIKV